MHDFNPHNTENMSQEQVKQMQIQATEITSMFKSALANKAGERLLDYLKKMYVEKPIYKQGQSFEVTAFRQGRADIVQQMIAEVNR